jgi:hypothetical protein
MTKDTNTGQRNTGQRNTGQRNTGDWNTGNGNVGNSNAGNRNTGHCNSGHWNSGSRNTGHCNSGHWNSGHWNSGSRNTGQRNTGDWNTGNRHVGCFNTVDAKSAHYFNKLLPVEVWRDAYKPKWLYEIKPTTWVDSVDMTDMEKDANPEYKTTGGYLRENDMKEEWRKAYAGGSPEDIQAVRDLPGFDADVFEQITGLDLREKPMPETCEGREIEIDGVTYVLILKGNHHVRP